MHHYKVKNTLYNKARSYGPGFLHLKEKSENLSDILLLFTGILYSSGMIL